MLLKEISSIASVDRLCRDACRHRIRSHAHQEKRYIGGLGFWLQCCPVPGALGTFEQTYSKRYVCMYVSSPLGLAVAALPEPWRRWCNWDQMKGYQVFFFFFFFPGESKPNAIVNVLVSSEAPFFSPGSTPSSRLKITRKSS